jgi:hypothetical protein
MKNLSDEKVSEAIAAVMGMCWHDFVHTNYLCKKCNKIFDPPKQFNAFTPDGVFAWKGYMEKEMSEVWEEYLDRMIYCDDYALITTAHAIKEIFYPLNLVQYLFDNLDGWGYRECPGAKDCQLVKCAYPDVSCQGNGKTRVVLTEKARKFKMIWEEK